MNEITIKSFTVARILGLVAFLLVLASIVGQLSTYVFGHGALKGLVPLFDVDRERNIPSYFSMMLLLIAALLFAVIAVLHGKQRVPHVSKWVILSIGFQFMAYDETLSVHEKLILPIRTLLGDSNLGAFYFAWVIPGIVLVIGLGLFFLRFLLYLPVTARFRFLMAATLYLGGAIGVELIGGSFAELHGTHNLTYSAITTVEESFELAGLIVLIWALLKYYADNFNDVRCRFEA